MLAFYLAAVLVSATAAIQCPNYPYLPTFEGLTCIRDNGKSRERRICYNCSSTIQLDDELPDPSIQCGQTYIAGVLETQSGSFAVANVVEPVFEPELPGSQLTVIRGNQGHRNKYVLSAVAIDQQQGATVTSRLLQVCVNTQQDVQHNAGSLKLRQFVNDDLERFPRDSLEGKFRPNNDANGNPDNNKGFTLVTFFDAPIQQSVMVEGANSKVVSQSSVSFSSGSGTITTEVFG